MRSIFMIFPRPHFPDDTVNPESGLDPILCILWPQRGAQQQLNPYFLLPLKALKIKREWKHSTFCSLVNDDVVDNSVHHGVAVDLNWLHVHPGWILYFTFQFLPFSNFELTFKFILKKDVVMSVDLNQLHVGVGFNLSSKKIHFFDTDDNSH